MISSECITWLAVFLTMSVAIVTVNLLLIVLLIKEPQPSHSCHVPSYKVACVAPTPFDACYAG